MTDEKESVVTTQAEPEPKRRGRPPLKKPAEATTGVTLSNMPTPKPVDDSADREKLVADLKAALLPFAKMPVDTARKPEEVEYKISRDNTTVEITKGNIIAAKKLLNLI